MESGHTCFLHLAHRGAPAYFFLSAVAKLARKGLTPSQIGVILRDSHGIAQVKSVTGQKILRVLKKQGQCWSLFSAPTAAAPSLYFELAFALQCVFSQMFAAKLTCNLPYIR